MKPISLDHWLDPAAGQQPLPALVCLFTDEPLFSTQAADLYRQRLKRSTEYQRHVLDMDRQFDAQEFLAQFAEASLFGDVSLVEVRLTQPKLNKDAAEALTQVAQWIKAGETAHHLLVLGPKLNKTQEKSDGFAQLLTLGCEIQCKPVTAENLPAWIVQSAQRKGLKLDRETATWLAEKTEGNLLAAHQAIEKLAVEHQGPVPFDTVQAMVSNSARFNVFDLGPSLLGGDTRRVARMIQGLEAEGEASTLVLWALQEEIRAIRDTQMAIRKGMALADACRQHRIWGARQNHISAALKRHNRTSLQNLTAWCYSAEKTIKGMKAGNPWTLLEIIGLGIAGVAPPPHA
ncbi:MAG TPA: DNA polymerase III subunit delta [Limnobacter sp.]|uniref:DNA polymerase III subunit delta n=1 Tax=Limnobacter sp. TaxID=2003368 RepID=UPI002EDA5027